MVVTLQGNPANNGVLRKDPHAGCNPATKNTFSKKSDIVRKRDFHKDKSLFLWNILGKSLSLHREREKSYEYDRN